MRTHIELDQISFMKSVPSIKNSILLLKYLVLWIAYLVMKLTLLLHYFVTPILLLNIRSLQFIYKILCASRKST